MIGFRNVFMCSTITTKFGNKTSMFCVYKTKYECYLLIHCVLWVSFLIWNWWLIVVVAFNLYILNCYIFVDSQITSPKYNSVFDRLSTTCLTTWASWGLIFSENITAILWHIIEMTMKQTFTSYSFGVSEWKTTWKCQRFVERNCPDKVDNDVDDDGDSWHIPWGGLAVMPAAGASHPCTWWRSPPPSVSPAPPSPAVSSSSLWRRQEFKSNSSTWKLRLNS